MTGLTEALARFIAEPGMRKLPPAAIAIARSGFIDAIATMIAGRDEPVVAIVRRFVEQRKAGAREASLLMGAERAGSSDAALINGTAAHALDYDDVAQGGHPSTVLVPAVLAEGERLGASGADALRAYVVGYEVWAELYGREPEAYHRKGWHPTAVLGTLGATAAAAHLQGQSVDGCRNALAIAASMAGGLVANFGTMTKPLHAGRAASCGIEAARLAGLGMTAAPDALEHQAGYLAALSPGGRADRRMTEDFGPGRRPRLLESGLSIKKYPMCYATHRIVDGVLELAQAHDVAWQEVAEVRATIGKGEASMLRNHCPVTGLEAKFSLEFAVACALVARRVGLSELTDRFVAQPAVRETMGKVRITTVDTVCPIDPAFALTHRVVLVLANGRTLDSGEIRFARGNAKLPLSKEDLAAKFLDCTSAARDIDGPSLYDALTRLEELAAIRNLVREVAAA